MKLSLQSFEIFHLTLFFFLKKDAVVPLGSSLHTAMEPIEEEYFVSQVIIYIIMKYHIIIEKVESFIIFVINIFHYLVLEFIQIPNV